MKRLSLLLAVLALYAAPVAHAFTADDEINVVIADGHQFQIACWVGSPSASGPRILTYATNQQLTPEQYIFAGDGTWMGSFGWAGHWHAQIVSRRIDPLTTVTNDGERWLHYYGTCVER